MTKKEAAGWIDCIANDKRIPHDVREMCADIVKKLDPKKKRKK